MMRLQPITKGPIVVRYEPVNPILQRLCAEFRERRRVALLARLAEAGIYERVESQAAARRKTRGELVRSGALRKVGGEIVVGYYRGLAVLALAAAVAAGGCNLVPADRSATVAQRDTQSVAAKTTTEFVEHVRGTPVPPPQPVVGSVSVGGRGNVVTIPTSQPAQLPSAGFTRETTARQGTAETGDSAADYTAATTLKIPILIAWGAGLLLIGIGGFLVFRLWQAARAASPAVAAVSSSLDSFVVTANQHLADLAHSIGTRTRAATDPAAIASLSSIEAEIQRTRANLNNDAPTAGGGK